MDVKKATTSTGFKLSVMTLAIMNITAVVSLRGLPAEAVYGLSSAFYYLFAAVVFLIPTAMVAAELAAMFSDKQGGVFRWVGEAYGARTGFLAIWLQWIESTIWYPTVLTFGAVSIAFIGMNETYDMSLASNKVFTLIVVLAIYWVATLVSLKGMDWVGKISKWGGMIGTIIPAGLLILLGIIYISTGGHNYMDMSQGFFPDLTNFDNPLAPGGNLECRWGNYEFKSHTTSISSTVDLVAIQMETNEYDGVVSRLGDILNSTENNRYYFEMTSSRSLLELSQAQRYVMVYTDPTTNLRDTISPGENTVYSDSRELGDLRLCSNVRVSHMSSRDDYSEDYQTLVRFSLSSTESSFLLYVPLYRLSSVYLRMAEAYNRAGLPESAFAVLKYGLSNGTVSKYINAGERGRAGNLLTWSQYNFITQDMSSTSTTTVNTEGIHSYGCGESYADTLYVIPEGLATREDSILFVEDLICDEMALEQSFLGVRFGDLQRIALRRGDTDFLARKVAGRDGKDSFNAELYSRLSDRNNWYLPLE